MKITIYILSFISLLIGSLFIWLTKPYMDYQSQRLNNILTEVNVEYRSMTGDPLCTKLYDVVSGRGIFPNVPDDVPDPHTIASLQEGDRITLIGYQYEWQARNLITGKTDKRALGMIDVVAWNNATDLHFKSQLENPQPQQFKRENYSDCH